MKINWYLKCIYFVIYYFLIYIIIFSCYPTIVTSAHIMYKKWLVWLDIMTWSNTSSYAKCHATFLRLAQQFASDSLIVTSLFILLFFYSIILVWILLSLILVCRYSCDEVLDTQILSQLSSLGQVDISGRILVFRL